MKNIKKITGVLFGMLVLQSCSPTYRSELQSIVKQQGITDIDRYSKMVLIPGTGCTGCITQAEHYFLRHCSDTSTLFILTYNFSLKEVAMRLGEENLKRQNVIVDKSNDFYLSHHTDAIYPIVCTLEKGHVSDIQRLN